MPRKTRVRRTEQAASGLRWRDLQDELRERWQQRRARVRGWRARSEQDTEPPAADRDGNEWRDAR